MTDPGSAQERPDYGQGATNIGPVPGFPGPAPGYPGQGAGYPGQGAAYPGQGAAYPGPGGPGYAPQQQAMATAKGFVASLFDFSFNSFVTPKVVKVVYVLVTILLGLTTLWFLVVAFKLGALAGIITLLIVAPLFFFIELALWRIALELFVVIFRIADDIRAIRDRGGVS